MKGLQLHGEDLHATGGGVANETNNFDGMDEDHSREIWLEREQEDLIDNASIFCDDFPPLLDFPCMSSSSSTQAPSVKAMACSSSTSSASSSSSGTSWVVLRSDAEDHNQHDPIDAPAAAVAALSSTGSMEISQPSDQGNSNIDGVDCIDVMENFGCIDLLDSNDFFDPSSIFHPDENPLGDFHQQQEQRLSSLQMNNNGGITQGGGGGEEPADDLAMVFLEWLKSNKESVSAEDLRNVKIKKSTIECAARRLGGGKEAMKQLLKLILEWVQTNHLQKRRIKDQNPNPNLNPIRQPDQTNPSCYTPPSMWIPQPTYVDPFQGQVIGYMGHDPYVHGAPNISPYPPTGDFHILDSCQSWSPSQFTMPPNYNSFPDNNFNPNSSGYVAGYPNQYQYPYLPGPGQGGTSTGGGGERLVRLGSSATKEARKKRMARQRRFLSHHRNHNHHQNGNQNHGADPHATRLGNDDCTPAVGEGTPASWLYWSPGVTSGPPVLPPDAPAVHQVDRPPMQAQGYQRQVSSDRRQGWKPEKNLKFLLQKVLKQSDVGNLGRIVLPKKEAETHLPELDARDGISIAMEDIGTSRVWNMRYRFWPNNKSRMYLLENTGDFIKTNGLQEGDFIVIYSDVKCGKYLIRGVKVRQPGPKSETKKAGKSQRNQHVNSSSAGVNNISHNISSSSTQTSKASSFRLASLHSASVVSLAPEPAEKYIKFCLFLSRTTQQKQAE
ncbi:B3 domain-containing transcription factor ABI3 [Tripterygium wilfordii]|uniref:B3 domain-containing transcription factor ABI3 n=1 Tax=Tripterygium wilfordii TaxID=458696 RepID=A0A7J7CBB4_TRIWF|nr:B3 domain-containing transcription factor ABI3 [Tripterygium wilfordii]